MNVMTTVTGTTMVYDPTAPSENKTISRMKVGDFAGKIVGFVDNAKPNFDLLVADMAKLLTEKYGAAEVIIRKKRGASMPAEEAVTAELAKKCDVVITGMGDCGGCTTWSIHDGVTIARHGKPSLTVCSDAFQILGRAQAKGLGYPDLPIVLVEHPFGGRKRDEVRALAEKTLAEIVKVLH